MLKNKFFISVTAVVIIFSYIFTTHSFIFATDSDSENNTSTHIHTNFEVRNAKEATVFEKGYSGDTYCAECGELVEKGVSIDGLAVAGDLDGDTIITPADRIILSRYLAGWSDVSEPKTENSDTDCNKETNIKDRIILSRALAGWAEYENIVIENNVSMEYYPNIKNIREESQRVSEKVKSVQGENTISFVAVSDMHYNTDNETTKSALTDMQIAVNKISEQTDVDFFVNFGDNIYRLAAAPSYAKGVTEMNAATEILNKAFGNNAQIRLVGNHDSNSLTSSNYFTKEQLYDYVGKYNNMIQTNPDEPYGNYGYCDFENQKVRLIVLNTSYYDETPTLGATHYGIGAEQGLWLCNTLDMSNKGAEAANWKIIIFSHVSVDSAKQAKTVGKYSTIINAYEKGTKVTIPDSGKSLSYDFSGKNQAKISLCVYGHSHKYDLGNVKYVQSDSSVKDTLSITRVAIPNALNERESASIDGNTYTKESLTTESTSFYVVTLDFDNNVAYFHHYGAGIDMIVHFETTDITSEQIFSTSVSNPVWTSQNTSTATVSGGIVSPVSNGNTTVYAQGDDGTIEAWNISVVA